MRFLKVIREKLGKSRYKMANDLEVGYARVKDIEENNELIPWRKLPAICRNYEITGDDLIRLIEKEERKERRESRE